jgi:two-component system KDP operon response regulator KdpE
MSIDSRPEVLIADDESAMARLVERSLTARGLKISIANGGSEAVDMIWEHHHDVLLLDLGMPGMGGLEVIRELHGRHPVRIIVVSGRSRASEISAALDLGADDYVIKPFAIDELVARVRSLLRRQRALVQGRRQLGHALVDFDASTITVGGEPAEMGRRGWRLLEHLVRLDGAVATHDEMLQHAFGPGYVGDDAYLRLWVGQLRRSLGVPMWEEGPIRSVPGIGYALDVHDRRPVRTPRRPRARLLSGQSG